MRVRGTGRSEESQCCGSGRELRGLRCGLLDRSVQVGARRAAHAEGGSNTITPRESLRAEARPGAYREASTGDAAQWTLRWFRWPYAFMVLFFIFWDAVCGSFVVVGLSGGGFGLFTLLLPHVWIGVIGSYWVLAHLFNRTTFTLTSQHFVVQSGPIPWPSKSIGREVISAFDVQKSWKNNGQEQFQLRVIDKEKRPSRVLGAITEEEARYLADALNHELERQG